MKRGLFMISTMVLALALVLSFGITGCTCEEASTTPATTSATTPAPTTTTPAPTTTTPAPTTETTEPTTPSEPATVYVSVSVDGELLVAAQPVTITDMTVEAAIEAAHVEFYSGGESGYKAGIDQTWGMYLISKCWGVQGTPYVIINDAPLGATAPEFVNTTAVVANDNVIICTSSDPMNTPAQPVALTATLSGDSVTVTAILWILDFTTFTYSSAPLADANVIDPTTGESLGTTDADGSITVTVPESGIVAIEGLAAINVEASAT